MKKELAKSFFRRLKIDGLVSTARQTIGWLESRKILEELAFESQEDIKNDIQQKYGYHGDFLKFFAESKEFPIRKWHHYIPLYAKYLEPFRGRGVRFLEIGVDQGGSLQLWRKVFGGDAIIFGIDNNPECFEQNGVAAEVRIGSQNDPEFLKSVVREMGGLDIVLDDGSHRMDHVMTSLRTLFPLLSDGGIYLIEDLHTAYWKGWGGGYDADANFFNCIRNIVDDMHHWYHGQAIKESQISQRCTGIHLHDSLVVMEKNTVHKPVHSEIR